MKTPIVYEYDQGYGRSQRALLIPKGTHLGTSFDMKKKNIATKQMVQLDGGSHYELGSDYVRMIPEDYIARLDEIDERMRNTKREHYDVMCEAFRRGRKVTKKDCETTEERSARIAASKNKGGPNAK